MHVAIIMDGNGRWATDRGLPRPVGHRAGADAVDRIVQAARARDIDVLTLYAFSSDNWRRPAPEVAGLMQLFLEYLDLERIRCVSEGIRVNVIGRRDRLTPQLLTAIDRIEADTRDGEHMLLRLAVDYSARQAIVATARREATRARTGRHEPAGDIPGFRAAMLRAIHSVAQVPDVDLLIRTGGEQRLSDFLLWECAYGEFVFTDRLWPDFSETEFARALCAFERRERRFGRLLSGPGARPRKEGSKR